MEGAGRGTGELLPRCPERAVKHYHQPFFLSGTGELIIIGTPETLPAQKATLRGGPELFSCRFHLENGSLALLFIPGTEDLSFVKTDAEREEIDEESYLQNHEKRVLRVLVADDSYVMRQNLKEIFQENGMEGVAETSNGRQALYEYGQHLPDLVTMDISMPIMDGLTAVKKILEKHPEATVIISSVEGQKSKLFQAIKGGAKHFLVKSITREKTMAVIKKVFTEKYS